MRHGHRVAAVNRRVAVARVVVDTALVKVKTSLLADNPAPVAGQVVAQVLAQVALLLRLTKRKTQPYAHR
jgi:hypothetical protein